MTFVALNTSVLVPVLLHVSDRWAVIFRRVSHECLAALCISRVSPLSWAPACTRLIRPFWMKEFLVQHGKSFIYRKKWTFHLPIFFLCSFQINYVLTPFAPRSSKNIGLHGDICPCFDISSFHISRFTWRSPKSFRLPLRHFSLGLSTFFFRLVFLWWSNLSQYRNLLHTAHWIEKLKSNSRRVLMLIQNVKFFLFS